MSQNGFNHKRHEPRETFLKTSNKFQFGFVSLVYFVVIELSFENFHQPDADDVVK